MNKPKSIFLMGPTAAGKTDAAIFLHKKYDCDIISVDSALVYKGMNIGSAKPDNETLAKAPHALVDICETWQPYSASTFCSDAKAIMKKTHASNRIPLLAGGTMLYYNALQHGLSSLPEADVSIREKIEQTATQKGWQHIHNLLAEVDPESAERINPNDPQRINRAYEVYLATGKNITHWYQQDQGETLDMDVLKIIISPEDRSVLHDRIAMRFDIMISHGFIDEMKTLMAEQRNHPELPSMRSVGYRQAWEFLEGKTTFEEFKFKSVVATRQLAKRQLTWLRKEQNAIWLDPMKPDYLDKLKSHMDMFLNQ